MTMAFTLGADPELFIRDTKTQQFISAEGIVPGTKDKPYYLNNSYEAVQVDGVAAEFNTAPAKDKTAFVRSVRSVVTVLGQYLKSNQRLEAVPVADFDPVYFSTLSEQSRELGCNPDFNAWTLDPNPMPQGEVPYRTGSGHIHVGFKSKHSCKPYEWSAPVNDMDSPKFFEECARIVRELDYYVGLPSLLWDGDGRRRSLYGRAGAFRMKPYGVEYRVLSNVWVTKPKLAEYIFDAVEYCMRQMDRGIFMYDKFSDMAQIIIDNNEVNWVKKHGNILERELPIVG